MNLKPCQRQYLKKFLFILVAKLQQKKLPAKKLTIIFSIFLFFDYNTLINK